MGWLVTGAGGQVGRALRAALDDVVALSRAELDITDASAVEAAIGTHRPDVVVNAAAYTNVDAAETDEAAAHAINAEGPANLAAACTKTGARLLHISTDYVFSGEATVPYDVDDETGPRSAYGRTKLAGEQAVLPDAWVVRTSWVYGAPGSFVDTIARLERERDTITVVADQWGSPTWARDLAAGLIELVEKAPPPGIYHCTNTGGATRQEQAQAVFEELGADPARVQPVTTAEMPRPAERPAYAVLSDRSWRTAGLTPLQPWRRALHEAMEAVRQ